MYLKYLFLVFYEILYNINTFTGKNVYKVTGVLSYSNLHNILKDIYDKKSTGRLKKKVLYIGYVVVLLNKERGRRI